MQFSRRVLFLLTIYFFPIFIIAQDSNVVNYSLFLEKSVSFGTVDTRVAYGTFKEGESFIIPSTILPKTPIDFSLYQNLYDALSGGKFGIEYGALNKDIIMKIFIRHLKPDIGTYVNLGAEEDTLFSYFEIRIWELPDSNFFPEDSSFYFNKGFHATFSLPKSEELNNFLNITGIGTNDSLGFAFLEEHRVESENIEDWNADGIETIETEDSVMFKSIHLSRIGGGRKKRISSKTFSIDTTTSIKEINLNSLPEGFELDQNYPNPFNPTTIISYSIPEIAHASFGSSSKVSLVVFDLLGRKVKTLFNAYQQPGRYEVTFDASTLSSGIYYYILETNNIRLARKMILVK